jgi:UTP-glucose-1-phosphate uridylyltransferase
MKRSPVRTVIFPVAGLGTRFLPATKATPKELLPVLDTPLIQYAINEARDAGIEKMIFVSHPSKTAIERYVMEDVWLGETLKARGKSDLATKLKDAAFGADVDNVVFTMQHEPLGLGHAVLCAKEHVLPGPVAVILPDDLILGRSCISELVEAYESSACGHLVATMPVAPEEIDKYGILSVSGRSGSLLLASGMVEKPNLADAPSNEAVVGRYILDERIFGTLATQSPGTGNEIQLTDAINAEAQTIGLAGFRFSGKRFDCGNKTGMLQAMLHIALHDTQYKVVFENLFAQRYFSIAA